VKLLPADAVSIEDDDIKMGLKPFQKWMQVGLIDRYVDKPNAKQAHEMSVYVLNNVVDTLSVNGEAFNPIDVATMADVSDVNTAKQIRRITSLVIDALFLSPAVEERKKK